MIRLPWSNRAIDRGGDGLVIRRNLVNVLEVGSENAPDKLIYLEHGVRSEFLREEQNKDLLR